MKINKNTFACLFLSSIFLFCPASAQNLSNDDTKYLIPGGQAIGVTLETDGVLVSAIGEVLTCEGKVKAPALDSGLKGGDIIKSLDKKNISSVEELTEALKCSGGQQIEISFERGKKLHTSHITPAKSKDTLSYCIGAWVKDAASGIGTLTYFDTKNSTFAALGHGICNPDTGNLIPLEKGKVLKSEIVSVVKGEKGIPGELKGVFTENKHILGTVNSNNDNGLFGKLNPDFKSDIPPVPIGKKEEVQKGKALILTSVSSEGTKSYEIEILRVFQGDTSGNKDMIIKITDKRLKDKTGGIVQGMSGSPIIQNGKIIGAVTHVFVNDPTKGYGIFIEDMIENTNLIK